MGTVFLAEDSKLLRQVAIKLVHSHPQFSNRMLQEARSAAAVVHPNVAAIFDVQTHESISFIVMEYVPGESLRAKIPPTGLHWQSAWNYARQIALGLNAAHRLGIIHRDLKPDNVIVSHNDVLKILDFGLARVLNDGGTDPIPSVSLAQSRSTKVAGTPGYVAPETQSSGLFNTRTDVFSFGVVLHELLTGQRPTASNARFRAPAPLRRLVQKCLSENPQQRPADASELLALLEKASPSRVLRIRLVSTFCCMALIVLSLVSYRFASAPVGARVEQLTSNSAEAPVSQSALSPDGSRLAYVDTRGLILLNLKTRQEIQLLQSSLVDQFSCISWFADSKRILVRGREAASVSSLLIVDCSSGKISRLGSPDSWLCAAPSPDGSRVAYSKLLSDGAEVGSFPLSNPNEPVTLYSTRKDERLFSSVAWSYDSSLVVFGAYTGRFEVKDAFLAVADWHTSQIATVFSDPALYQQSYTGAFAWRDARKLIFALAPQKPFDDIQDIRILDLPSNPFASTAKRQFSHSSFAKAQGSVIGSLSADNAASRLTYIRFAKQSDIWTASLPQNGLPFSNLHKLTLTERSEWPSDWSEDDFKILAVVEGKSAYTASLLPLDGSIASPLLSSENWTTWPVSAWNSYLFWSVSPKPDGAESSLLQYDNLAPAKTLLSRQASSVDGTGRPPPRETWLRCANAAKRCFLLQQQSTGGLTLDELLPDGQTIRRSKNLIDVAWTRGFALSPDATKVAIADQSRRQLLIVSTDGEVISSLKPERGVVQFASWTRDASSLVVTTMGGPKSFTLELWTESSREVLWSNDWAWLTHPVVSRDGTKVAFAATPFHGNLWSIQR
jgi:serine/threonine protein kinase